jgi:hypothetical protein
MILRRFKGLDVSVHSSADAEPDTLSRQENADGFIDGAHFPRLGTRHLGRNWFGAIGIAGALHADATRVSTVPVRTLGPVGGLAASLLPTSPED